MFHEIKDIYNNYVKPTNLYLGLVVFIYSWVVTYTSGADPIWSEINTYSIMFIFISGVIGSSFKKNRAMLLATLALLLVTVVALGFGKHIKASTESYNYVYGLIIFILMSVSISDYFYDKLHRFLFTWQVTLSAVLVSLSLTYNSEINVKLSGLFQGIISNTRMERIGIGFYAINTLGFFAGILIIVSVFQMLSKRFMLFSITTLIFGILLLLNAGTRSVLLSVFGFTISLILLRVVKLFFSKHMKLIWYIMTGGIVLVNGVYLVILLVIKRGSELYTTLNVLSTGRIDYGTQGSQYIEKHSQLLFGTGLRQMYQIREHFFTHWPSWAGLDGDMPYYVFTAGLIGALLVLVIWAFIMIKIYKTHNLIYWSGFIYLSVMMLFEHVFLYRYGVSGSNAAFWIPFMVIAFRALSDSKQTQQPLRTQRSKNITNEIDGALRTRVSRNARYHN
ncbi:MAG: hypothetical protein LBT37_04525 [Lactobacillaceae bacterium]|nr:hypothetical protein [Lactobacillaceae bacterium]